MCAQRRGAIAVKSADPINLESLLDDFMRLYKPRWPHVAGELEERPSKRFFARPRKMLASGILRLSVIYLNRRAIGGYFGFTHRRRAYYYLGSLEPEYRHLKSITLATAHAIEQGSSKSRGLRLLARYEPDNYLWGTKDEIISIFLRAGNGGSALPPLEAVYLSFSSK